MTTPPSFDIKDVLVAAKLYATKIGDMYDTTTSYLDIREKQGVLEVRLQPSNILIPPAVVTIASEAAALLRGLSASPPARLRSNLPRLEAQSASWEDLPIDPKVEEKLKRLANKQAVLEKKVASARWDNSIPDSVLFSVMAPLQSCIQEQEHLKKKVARATLKMAAREKLVNEINTLRKKLAEAEENWAAFTAWAVQHGVQV